MDQIISIPFQKMKNLSHITLMKDVAGLLSTENIPTEGFEVQIQTFHMALQAEGEAIQVRRKSYLTDELVKMNEQREELYAGMHYYYESSLRHYDASIRKAALEISHIMKSIAYIHNASNMNRSIYIGKIIANIRKSDTRVETLQLQGWLTALDELNRGYQKRWLDRVVENSEKRNGNVLVARVITDKAYMDIIKRINAITTLTGGEEYDHFVQLLNVYIANEKRSIAIRAGWRRHKKEEKEKEETQPE